MGRGKSQSSTGEQVAFEITLETTPTMEVLAQ